MVKYRSMLEHVLIFCLNSYGAMLSLLLALWFFTGERLFFVNLFVSITPAIFYALPFMLFLGILLKSRDALLLLLIPTIACTLWYAPRFLPRNIERVEGQELVLLTYNLFAGNHNYEALDAVLSEADADIVALQEVNWQTADWLEANWTSEYPYHVRFTAEANYSQYSGRYLLSRYPIINYEFVDSTLEGRLLYLRAEINVRGQAIVVYNNHNPAPSYVPMFDTSFRSTSQTILMNAAQAETRPVIIMGDFNMTDQSEDYRRMSSNYQDAFVETSTGLGTSFPNGRRFYGNFGFLPSMIRIDYIFLNDAFAPQEARVLHEGASDHFPLWARIILED